MSAPPPISPDGAYWWDGQTWQPIPHEGPIAPPGVPVVEPAPPPWAPPASTAVAKTRPLGTASWFPDDMEEIPALAPAQAPPKIYDTAPPASTVPPPVWRPGVRNAAIRRVLTIIAIAIVAIVALGSGALVVQRYGLPAVSALISRSTSKATPSPASSPSPILNRPMTAAITATACPAAHVGDPVCWLVSFSNSGPAIGNLVMIFDTDAPYSNWFEHHFGADMAPKDNDAGCLIDSIHLQIVCGSVPAGAHITIHLIGYAANVGTHTYSVRFADISSGVPVDINLRADGTPTLITWTETIS